MISFVPRLDTGLTAVLCGVDTTLAWPTVSRGSPSTNDARNSSDALNQNFQSEKKTAANRGTALGRPIPDIYTL